MSELFHKIIFRQSRSRNVVCRACGRPFENKEVYERHFIAENSQVVDYYTKHAYACEYLNDDLVDRSNTK